MAMETVLQVIQRLKAQGYNEDFNLKPSRLHKCREDIEHAPSDYKIDKMYRFEGVSNPDDASILYAISSLKSKHKGYFVNGYGAYADPTAEKIIENLKIEKPD